MPGFGVWKVGPMDSVFRGEKWGGEAGDAFSRLAAGGKRPGLGWGWADYFSKYEYLDRIPEQKKKIFLSRQKTAL